MVPFFFVHRASLYFVILYIVDKMEEYIWNWE